MSLRLVASDIDGTIMDHDGVISARTRQAFAAARDAGVEVVFVTGRPPRWLSPLAEQIGHEGTVICSNGAVVWDLGRGELRSVEALSREQVLELQEQIRAVHPEAGFAAECVESFHLDPGFERIAGQRREGMPEPALLEHSLLETDRVVKFLALSPTLCAEDFHARVVAEVGPLAHVTHSDARYSLLEISAPGVTKARTLSAYAQAKGIAATEVIAFGDMPNDVQMLAWAGEGYAMTGGHVQALACTVLRAPALAEDGVAQVLEAKLRRLSEGPDTSTLLHPLG